MRIVGANWSSYPRIFVQQASRVKFGDIRLPLAVLSCVASKDKGSKRRTPSVDSIHGGRRDAIASRVAVDCQAASSEFYEDSRYSGDVVRFCDTVDDIGETAGGLGILFRIQSHEGLEVWADATGISARGCETSQPGCGQPHDAVICFVGSENAQHFQRSLNINSR